MEKPGFLNVMGQYALPIFNSLKRLKSILYLIISNMSVTF